jgi:hypothetical protein
MSAVIALLPYVAKSKRKYSHTEIESDQRIWSYRVENMHLYGFSALFNLHSSI